MKDEKWIDINTRRLEDNYTWCARVYEYPDAAKRNGVAVVNPRQKITEATTIKIVFDYPLTNPATFTFKNEKGFTRLDLFKAIYEGYKAIYDAEKDPGTVNPVVLNRASSEGPYGIWGHYMDDLIVEGVRKGRGNTYHLAIGS
jgi:hypothetical protein